MDEAGDPSLLANTLGSALASIVSRMTTHPLDTAKARLQAPPPPIQNGSKAHYYTGPLDVLVRTGKTEGIRGLYRGIGAVLIGGTPGTVLYLCSYDIAKTRLSQVNGGGENNFAVHFLAGMVAESIACIIYVPVDIVKERLQVQHSRKVGGGDPPHDQYRNSLDALRQISKHEGLSGIYRGYGATLASFGSFSAFYFGFYEHCKDMSRRHLQIGRYDSSSSYSGIGEPALPFHWIILCSASSGALASWLTSPLDMAKLRLQVQRGKLYGSPPRAAELHTQMYMGVADCLRKSFREGGLRGLFRGAGARVLHFAPATTVTMTAYESCRSVINNWR